MPEKNKAQQKIVATAEHNFKQPFNWLYYTNMKLLLNISERLYALALLNQFKGNIETMVDILEDVKGFKISDDDWVKAEKQVVPTTDKDGNPASSWQWNDEKGGDKEIEIAKSTKDYLTAKIKELNDKGELTFQDRAVITLSGKLLEGSEISKKEK